MIEPDCSVRKYCEKGIKNGSAENKGSTQIQVKRKEGFDGRERENAVYAQQFDDDKAKNQEREVQFELYSTTDTNRWVYSHLYPLLSCQLVTDRSVILLKLYFEQLWRFPNV
jgi:hypothetical protein